MHVLTDPRGAVRYLVCKTLGGRSEVVEVLFRYFVLNESPGDLEHRYGVGRFKIRGYAQRLVEKVGSHRAAARLLLACYGELLSVKPVVHPANNGGSVVYYCSACGKLVAKPEEHVRKSHRGTVEVVVERCWRRFVGEVRRWGAERR